MQIYSRFNRPDSPGVEFTEPTLTQQQFAEETDVNRIMKHVMSTGDVSALNPQDRTEFYYDCTVYEDYQESMNFIQDIRDDFRTLPASVRRQFNDDLDTYVQFVTDPANYDRSVELGLLEGTGGPLADSPPAVPAVDESGTDESARSE